MTVCKNCNGLGKIKLMPFGYICTCAECKGTGETRDYMTNEEWLATLSTGEKAEVLNDLYWEFDYKARLYYNFEPTKKSFEKWLKQPHTTKVEK